MAMKVELISHTPDPEMAVAPAVRTCHAPEVPKGRMGRPFEWQY